MDISGSIMQYDGGDLKYPAMSARNSNYQQSMGQNKGPSFYDIREMNNYFGCNGNVLDDRIKISILGCAMKCTNYLSKSARLFHFAVLKMIDLRVERTN